VQLYERFFFFWHTLFFMDWYLRRIINFFFFSFPATDIWRLRHNLSAYDAAYVALTERLGATLLTRDARLASALPHTLSVELF